MADTFLPVVLHPDTDLALVAGGGTEALRKARWLHDHRWRLRVVAPELDPGLGELAAAGDPPVELLERPWRPADLEGVGLVMGATDSAAVNAAVSAEARKRGLPVNVVDEPELSTFFVPGCVRRGPLEITVGTGGGIPALASRIRAELEEAYPEWYGDYADALCWARMRLREQCPDAALRRKVLARLASRESARELGSLRGDLLRRELLQRSDRLLRKESDTDTHRRATEG